MFTRRFSAELGVHPVEDDGHHELYLMCDDLQATVEELRNKGVEFTQPITDERFGRVTRMNIPGGGELGIYQPKRPSPLTAATTHGWEADKDVRRGPEGPPY